MKLLTTILFFILFSTAYTIDFCKLLLITSHKHFELDLRVTYIGPILKGDLKIPEHYFVTTNSTLNRTHGITTITYMLDHDYSELNKKKPKLKVSPIESFKGGIYYISGCITSMGIENSRSYLTFTYSDSLKQKNFEIIDFRQI